MEFSLVGRCVSIFSAGLFNAVQVCLYVCFRAARLMVKQHFLTSYRVMADRPVLGKAFQQQWLICV